MFISASNIKTKAIAHRDLTVASNIKTKAIAYRDLTVASYHA